jgi:hypothetical protein
VLFIVDHLDVADVTLVPNEPFTAGEENEFLIEFLALMLMSDTFVAAARCEEELLRCLSPGTTGALDLGDNLTIVSVVDVDTDHTPRFKFAVRTADGDFRISMDTCGGCSGYLVLWDGIVANARRVQDAEKADSTSNYAQELRANLTTLLAELCVLLFPTWKGKITSLDFFDTDEEIPEHS